MRWIFCGPIFCLQAFVTHFAFVTTSAAILQAGDSFNDDISIVNIFSDCLVRAITFNGLNINFPNLLQPIVLLHYFSFPDNILLYPVESRNKLNKFQQTKKNIFPLSNNATIKNQGTSFNLESSLAYIDLILGKHSQLINKNTNCVANT